MSLQLTTIYIRALASARGSVAQKSKGLKTKETATRGPEGPESGQNMRVRGPEGPEDEQNPVALASATICFSRFSQHHRSQSGRWQAPAAVLPPEGWQRGRGPEGPEDKGHGHSRARRAREWPKHASPRARRARGRAKLSARLGACQCYYMFFTTQLKIANFMGRSQDLNVGQKS